MRLLAQPGSRAQRESSGDCGAENDLWTRPWHLALAAASRPLEPAPARACITQRAISSGRVRARLHHCQPIRLVDRNRLVHQVRAGGLSLAVTAGWYARSYRGGDRGTMPVLRVANFRLPAAHADDDIGGRAQMRMGRGGILIDLFDWGRPDRRVGAVPARLPVRIRQRDLGSFCGLRPGAAVRVLVLNGRVVWLAVVFGASVPSPTLLADANRVLATLRVRRPRTE